MNEVSLEDVQRWIEQGQKNNEVEDCLFNILILDKNYKSNVFGLLSNSDVVMKMVDTIPGCWNLNEDWIEFKAPAVITWGGVYPVKWKVQDTFRLRELYFDRKIYINVYHMVGGKYEPIT